MGVSIEKNILAPTRANGNLKEAVSPFPALPAWEKWFVRHGVKQMAGAQTSHTEWSKTVVGLIASIVALVVILAGSVWYMATQASELSHTKEDLRKLEERFNLQEAETRKANEMKIKEAAYGMGYKEAKADQKEK